MRTVWCLLGLPSAMLLGVLGCANPDANLKPPPHPEAYNLPPENDPKISEPVSYPKHLLFQDTIHPPTGDGGGLPGGPGSPGGGLHSPGMGGGPS